MWMQICECVLDIFLLTLRTHSFLHALSDTHTRTHTQMGIAGMLLQESLTGQTTFQQIAAGHYNPFGDGQGKCVYEYMCVCDLQER